MDPLTLSVLAKPGAKLVQKLLSPLFTKIEKELSDNAQLAWHRLFNSYTAYLDNAVERHSYFTSVVFKNEQRKLSDYYVPLTLIQNRDKQKCVIDRFPKVLIDEVRRMLIVDSAGMGKTTLLKHIFLKCVEEEAGIPIFVELRKLSKKRMLLDFILEQLSDIKGGCKPDLFFKLLSGGNFIFFLDGYDEIPEAERYEVTGSIQSFIEKTPGNRFIMTSRDELGLTAFAQFQRYTIKPLQKQEAFTLLRKYSADRNLTDLLIEKLKAPENAAIHEFLTSPLLTSLLFKSFEYKHVIPLKRHIFYRQVYEALYDTHDLTKEGGEFLRIKKSGLDIDRMAKILRSFGAITYKAGKSEFTKEDALTFLDEARKSAVEPKITSSDILHDITHAVPLFVVEGNYVRWSHRSIQEYFAAQFICRKTDGNGAEVLLRHYDKSDYAQHINLILLCADMDRFLFDQSIGCRLAAELLKNYNEIYLNYPSEIFPELLQQRKQLTTGRIPFFLRAQNIPTASERDENPNAGREIHARMWALGGSRIFNGTSIHYADPSYGFCVTKQDFFVSESFGRLELPFVIKITKRGQSDMGFVNKSIDLLEISDDLNIVFNLPENFERTNLFLASIMRWRFDPVAANKYIAEVNEETVDRASGDPW